MSYDTINDLDNYVSALYGMSKIPDSLEKFEHMLGMCELMQQSLDDFKTEIKDTIESNKRV